MKDRFHIQWSKHVPLLSVVTEVIPGLRAMFFLRALANLLPRGYDQNSQDSKITLKYGLRIL